MLECLCKQAAHSAELMGEAPVMVVGGEEQPPLPSCSRGDNTSKCILVYEDQDLELAVWILWP